MIAFTKKLIFLIVGWFFLVLGVIGLFLPVLQGLLFIFIGLIFLSKESKVAHNLLERLKEKYPGPYQSMTRFRRRLFIGINRMVGR